MARTTQALVQGVLGGNWDGASSVQPYIDAATALVSRVKVKAAARGVTLTDAELELIERWLAAHYYTRMDPVYMSKQTVGAGGTFQRGKGDLGDYALAACDLDPSGALRGLLAGRRAGVAWLGKPPSAQIDVEDRD